MHTAAKKLCPDRLRTSGKMSAILGFVCGETWTRPAITEMVETSDGFVLAANTEDPFMNDIVGSRSDLWRNIAGAAKAAELTKREQAWLLEQARAKIRRA